MDNDPSSAEFVTLAEKVKVFKSIDDILSIDAFVTNEQVEEASDGSAVFGQVVDLESSNDGPLKNSGFDRVVIVRAEPYSKIGVQMPEQTFVAAYGKLGNENEVYQFIIDVDSDGYPSVATRQDSESFIEDSLEEKASISRKDLGTLNDILDATKSEIGVSDLDIQDFVSNETIEFERLKTESSKNLRDLVRLAENTERQESDEHGDSSIALILPITGTEDGLRSIGYTYVEVEYTSPASRHPLDTFIISVEGIDGGHRTYEHKLSPDGRTMTWNEIVPDSDDANESRDEMIRLLKLGQDDLASLVEGIPEPDFHELEYDEMSELENIINMARFDAGVELPRHDDLD